MIMKKYIYIAMLLCVGMLGACVEDKGSYDYIELNDLTIEPLEESYTVEQFTNLQIPTTITARDGAFNPEGYDYKWIIYSQNDPNFKSDTISTEKDLDAAGLLDPVIVQVVHGRAVQGGLEKTAEILGAHPGQAGEVGQTDGRGVMGIDVFQHRFVYNFHHRFGYPVRKRSQPYSHSSSHYHRLHKSLRVVFAIIRKNLLKYSQSRPKICCARASIGV